MAVVFGPTVTPTTFLTEKWMTVDVGGATLFTFSGTAQFGNPFLGVHGDDPLVGQGDDDTSEQMDYVHYKITDMVVGPHWDAVRQMCPSVWVSGHCQVAPDEADGMGWGNLGIEKVNLVDFGSHKRIEFHLHCEIAGGFDPPIGGRIPSISYRVSALGQLADTIGDEGVFFGDPSF